MAPAIELRRERRPRLRRAGRASGVTLTLEPGRTLAVFGANGAGKTTLLRILATLLRPHAGRARVLGRDLPQRRLGGARPRRPARARPAALPRAVRAREPALPRPAARRRRGARGGAARPGRAAPARRRAGAHALARHGPARRRSAAPSLHEPELLLLDEPLANLDPGARRGGRAADRARGRPGARADLPRRRARPGGGRPRARAARRAARRCSSAARRGRRARSTMAGADVPRRGSPPRDARGRRLPARCALVRKDLRLELRTARVRAGDVAVLASRRSCCSTSGSTATTLEGDLASGVLWVTLLFAAVLGMNRLFVAEREQGGFDAFLLAPVDRTALFVAKAAVLFGFLVAVEVVGGAGLRRAAARARRRGRRCRGCSPCSLLADVGIAVDRHAGRRAGDPDPRARPDRAADRAAAAPPGA